MIEPPDYFERIRQKAAARWDQLECDHDLAGPWHQLFKEVQSPRHVLFELLQNADDARADEVGVRIEDGVFLFEHNGEDFVEEHFASLCRFGYSNKRHLHTIGFRGVGFKSTFSLGDCVEVYTPTLAVCFDRRRFTEPRWSERGVRSDGKTCIRVAVKDEQRRREVERNLEEWKQSALSLLFFKHIRRMRVGGAEVHWRAIDAGPVTDSEWMTLGEGDSSTFLLIRSEAEPFPEQALAEIRQERMQKVGEETDFPPCKVEIVLGSKGCLYVVLPTGVETKLPFACNAPFIQDPARLKIRNPETSPTNRWLLERTGKLAAAAMSQWLGQTGAPIEERAHAYRLLPNVDRDENTIGGVCGTIVEEAFREAIHGEPLLLTEDGQLVPERKSLVIPAELLNVFSAETASALLDDEKRPPLCRHVSTGDRKKLVRWGIIEELDTAGVLETLERKHAPKPATWRQLMILWAYVAPQVTRYLARVSAEELHIVPVRGKDVLYAARNVLRLGEKKLLQSEADWEFLATDLIVLDQNWLRFLARQRRDTSDQDGDSTPESVRAAYAVLEKTGLDSTSDVSRVICSVAGRFFSRESINREGCVRLAQICAKLRADVGGEFRYITRNGSLRSTEKGVLFDRDGTLEELLPLTQQESTLLHPHYLRFTSCTRDEWGEWIRSGKARLHIFPIIRACKREFTSKHAFLNRLNALGYSEDPYFPYKSGRTYSSQRYYLVDFDFESGVTEYWSGLFAETNVGRTVAEFLLRERPSLWKEKQYVLAEQTSTNGISTKKIELIDFPAAWLRRLSLDACLPDTRGNLYRPGDLLRRTPETESVKDVEPFVDPRLDSEATRPLLDLLGVRNAPTGPDHLLERLRALSKSESPPVQEVEKWYRRLDLMVTNGSTEDVQTISEAFRSERLILTEDAAWVSSPEVFLSAHEDDVPGAPVIRTAVRELSLWRRIGVAERATSDLAIAWLQSLPSGEELAQDQARRVRALTARHPLRVWQECGHWMNVVREWTPVQSLFYSLTMQLPVQGENLHLWVKRKTADFRRLPLEVTSKPPFSELPALAASIEERFSLDPSLTGRSCRKEWLATLGEGLRRIELDTGEETRRVRQLAETLATRSWQEASSMTVLPYIGGKPAGTPRRADVIWLDGTLYVAPLSKARLARRVPEEIGQAFGHSDIKSALDYCFERSPEDVRQYLEENFKLAPPESIEQEPVPDSSGHATQAPAEYHAASPEEASQAPMAPATGADIGSDSLSADTEGPDAADSSQEDADSYEHVAPRPPHEKPAHRQATLIERFASAQGYRKAGADEFVHHDGRRIVRDRESAFPWQIRSASGEVTYYLPLNVCFESGPLEIAVERWALLETHPDFYSLILRGPDGRPVERTGTELRGMLERGEIKLYPATYRIVREEGEERREA